MAGKFFTSQGSYSNTDIDTIFHPRGSLTKRPDVGLLDAGVDISNLYAPVAFGSSPNATGIQSDGQDLSNLFAAAGSVVAIQLTAPGTLVSQINRGFDPPASAAAGIELQSGGQARTYTINFYGEGPTFINRTNEWMNPLGANPGSNYEARAVLTASSGSGSPIGIFDEWLSLGTTRQWGFSLSTDGIGSATIQITIRLASSSNLTVASFPILVSQEP